jgi:hypothetical protein
VRSLLTCCCGISFPLFYGRGLFNCKWHGDDHA